jgi:predicted small secreted protein
VILRRALLLSLVLYCWTLTGCSTPSRIDGTGEIVSPPAGWVDYCRRHPADPGCQ